MQQQYQFLFSQLDLYSQTSSLSPQSLARYQRRLQKRQKLLQAHNQQSRKARLKFLKQKHKRRLKRKLQGLTDQQIKVMKDKKDLTKKKQKNNAVQGFVNGFPIAIDCAYHEAMNSYQHRSLVQQIRLTYIVMRKAAKPASLSVLGLGQQYIPLLQKLSMRQLPIRYSNQPLLQLFRDHSIVYLSPDAQDKLEEVGKGKEVYVIGGLVDRSIYKNASLKIRTCRLPIDHLIGFKNCLNIDVVAHLLCKRAQGLSWQQSVESVIPTKNKRGRSEKKENKLT